MRHIRKEDILEIIQKQHIKTVYQPIVSLHNGKVVAYEALSRVTGEHKDIAISDIFDMANQLGCLWALEKVCRNRALEQACRKPNNAKLFLNVDGNVILDVEFVKGFTKEKLEQIGLKTNEVVFEITERSDVENRDMLLKLVKHYENQGFAIAIDDIGSGYSGLNRMNYLNPQYIKVDYELVHNIHKSKSQKSIVELMANHCKEMKYVLIAEGIESREELECLIQLGVDCGQGFYLGKPKEKFEDISEGTRKIIKQMHDKAEKRKGKSKKRIDSISRMGMILYPECTVLRAYNLFTIDNKLNEIAVVDKKSRLRGILIRDKFMKYCNSQKSYKGKVEGELKDIKADYKLFSVDAGCSIKKAAKQVMERPEGEWYDAFALVDEGRYCGMVNVRDLIRVLTEMEN